MVRLATWNINSARARIERIINVLERHDLDVLALQEIKCTADQFPTAELTTRGYDVVAYGLNQWNGVAIISRLPMSEVNTQFPGQPGFTKGLPENETAEKYLAGPLEARAISATINGVEIWSLYVPNGRQIADPHYYYKLDFLNQLSNFATSKLTTNPNAQFAFVGDWNVIPTDDDIWDPTALESELYLSEAERTAFANISASGMQEISRQFATNYTFWDYQKLRFPKNQGMRIDYLFASPALASRAIAGKIDRDERKGKGASDHVPVIIEFAENSASHH